MKHILPFIIATAALSLAACGGPISDVTGYGSPDGVKTITQAHDWAPDIDIRCDATQIVNPQPERIADVAKLWREHGYLPCFQNTISWGTFERYGEFFNGGWDGTPHYEDIQRDRRDSVAGKFHLIPSQSFVEYYCQRQIRPAIDAGITHLFMEEPEIWVKSGYSEGFKREWQSYYGQPWRPQHESAEAAYMSSKLKYWLNLNMIDSVYTFAKRYGKSRGLDVKCYIPTHTLLNYSMWNIVSPEASLATLPCVDGYIVQAWTGTSRYPEYYNGVYKERTLENGYLEYACMKSMTEPTGRKVWFLTDPIEDARRSWDDYGRNYHATYVAQLLQPEVADYQVMPSPHRIYRNKYKKSATSDSLITIPPYYSTMMQVMVNALQEMPTTSNRVSGPQGISVLMGNSLMFQRVPVDTSYIDPELASFYGLTMPLVKRGIPVSIAHLENLQYPKSLAGTRLLLMTYANMKPLDPTAHDYIARWVRGGGRLIYAARDDDPYQRISEWWNTGGNSYAGPSDHLFEKLGIAAHPAEGTYRCGKGIVSVLRQNPQEYAMTADGCQKIIAAVEAAYPGKIAYSNSLYLRRGPYRIVAVMDESVSQEPYTLTGKLIDILDPELPVYRERSVGVGHQAVYYDADYAGRGPKVLATAGRAYDQKSDHGRFTFIVKGPANTRNVSRILLRSQPKSVKVNGREVCSPAEWDAYSRTYRLVFTNDPEGVSVEII